jgi:hypothetical protein
MKTATISLQARILSAPCKARSLPAGANRNELRQQAMALRWLEQHGSIGAKDRAAALFVDPDRILQHREEA